MSAPQDDPALGPINPRPVRTPYVRRARRHVVAIALIAAASPAACSSASRPEADLTPEAQRALGDSVWQELRSTYRFDGEDVVSRFMALYADTGRVISAASGGYTTNRDSVRVALTRFWDGAGKYMREPTWTWGPVAIDVLGRNGVVITAGYTVPHWTPDGAPHVIGGVWTSAWARRAGHWRIVQEHLSDMPRAEASRLELAMPRKP